MAIFDLPVDARPERDTPVGRDEFGRMVYRTAIGQQYTLPEPPKLAPRAAGPMQGPLAYASPQRMAEMSAYASDLRGIQGSYGAEDLYAAGYSPMEVAAFSTAGRPAVPFSQEADRDRQRAPAAVLQEPDYTLRQEVTNKLQDALMQQGGMNAYEAGKYARRTMGDPNAAGILESMGLIDLASMLGSGAFLAAKGVGLAGRAIAAAPAALSGLFNVEEGAQTAQRGYQEGSALQAGLGALQAVAGMAEMFPAGKMIAEGIARNVSRMDPNTLFSVFGPPIPPQPVRAPDTGAGAGGMARQFVADESGAVPLMGGGTAGPTQEAKQAAENAFAAARQAYENNPVNARGAQIIDMLTSGRADEITDQMLDMGDPVLNANLNQYLYRNYDLPMDEASRMERARQMGFSIDPKYHGSFSEDIPAFSGNMLGKRFNNRASKAGVWSSTNPDDAEFYGPNTYPVLLGGRYESLPSMEDMYRDTLGRLKSTQAKMERDYMGERYSSEAEKRLSRLVDIMENDQPPSLYTDIAASNISKAKGKKFEGAVLRGGETVQDVSPAGDNYVTFDPANIRSRFARFDLRLSHLRNLSAGVGGAAVLTALGDDAEAGTPEMQIIGLVNQAGIAGAAEALGVSRRDIEEAISIAVPPSQWDQLVAGPQ